MNKRLNRQNGWIFLGGLALGVLALLFIRFFTYNPPHVHYHANFAVYINDQQEQFKSAQYYQEVNICSVDEGITIPQQRAHMHDNMNSLIHVHDHAVTWGQFFENLGWSVGPNFIQTAAGTMYAENGTSKLHVILNGQDYTDLTPVTNMIIQDKSRLLVSYGDINDKQLQAEYKSVPATAAHYDVTKDPSSCSGDEGPTAKERLHHLF